MNLEKVDLQEIVESVLNSIQKQVSKKHHRIILEDFSPQEIKGMRKRLIEVFENIFSNAVK